MHTIFLLIAILLILVIISVHIGLTSTVDASNYTKCISLNNLQCLIQPTLINLHPDE